MVGIGSIQLSMPLAAKWTDVVHYIEYIELG